MPTSKFRYIDLIDKNREFALSREKECRKAMEQGESERSYHAGQAAAFAIMAALLDMSSIAGYDA